MKRIQFSATPAEQLREIKKGVSELLPEAEFLKKLEDSYREGRPLVVKFGADPSRPDLHLGHAVVINKLKLLQDFGHEVNFLIGDFTAQIGDPTGRKKARMQLSEAEVKENAKSYQDQIFKILDPAKTKIVFNSTWLNPVRLQAFLQTLMTTTLVQLLSREDFTERFKSEEPIFLHEFMYPILQGYDSVAMKADIELGGTDQKFNLLMGRHLQKAYQQEQQVLLITPILEGLDGVNKMSKSLDNYIGLTEPAKDIFGKVMSISDPLMLRYYELVSFMSVDALAKLRVDLQSGAAHPMEAKKKLAEEIVDRYHGAGAGAEERRRFEELFSKKSGNAEMATVVPTLDADGKLNLVSLLVERGFVKSRSDARRLLAQNAVKLDGIAVKDEVIALERGREYILKSGKIHHIKLCV